jgi:NAD(P)-dependent dehydrogenase (short-subunit alcohol dehydrogenase family)
MTGRLAGKVALVTGTGSGMASDESSFITGTEITIDDGYTAL